MQISINLQTDAVKVPPHDNETNYFSRKILAKKLKWNTHTRDTFIRYKTYCDLRMMIVDKLKVTDTM